MTMLSKILLGVTLTATLLGSTGCVEAYRLYKHYSRVEVAYADATAWRCQETAIPSGASFETCALCLNRSDVSQPVAIAGVESMVPPLGTVMGCQDRAWIEPPPVPTALKPR